MTVRRAAAPVLLALSILAIGCGGGGGDSTTASTSASSTAAQAPPVAPHRERTSKAVPKQHPSSSGSGTKATHDSATGAASFETKGGDNSIQESGSEAGAFEVSQAAIALHGYLNARAAGEWAKACSYMAAGVTAQLAQFSAGSAGDKKTPSCAKLLAGLSVGIPAATMREAAQADVGALRVEGESAFLLCHGAHGVDYFMPMDREGGDWKVAAIAPSALS
jgi:hypothetical protein